MFLVAKFSSNLGLIQITSINVVDELRQKIKLIIQNISSNLSIHEKLTWCQK